MNTETFLLLAEKNTADIEAIVTKIGGVSNLLALLPNILNIIKTLEAATPKAQ